MVARFTETEMLRLAEIYKDYDCLWNVSSCFYKNRDTRENAYKEIWKQLNVPGLSIKDIPIKIKNLRTSYHQELKKIQISIHSGASADSVYKPKVSWFETVDGYLNAFKNIKNTHANTDIQSNTSDCASDTEQNYVDDMFVEEKYNPAEAPQLLDCSYSMPVELREQSDIVKSERPTRTSKNDGINEAIEKIDKIADLMTRNIKPTPRPGEDEFDSFGKYIAAVLRTLPPEASILAKTELQKTLSHIQLRSIRQS